jgi:hypothetical protein
LVVVITTALALLSAEAAFRIVSGKKVFALTKYRAANIIYDEFPKNVMAYDPLLGWRLNPGVRTPMFNTIDHGIRRNSFADDQARSGGILVSGASFTAGSEVKDDEPWPVQLETLIGKPVVNGAIGGFGADQIIMRAEEIAANHQTSSAHHRSCSRQYRNCWPILRRISEAVFHGRE